MQIKGLLIIGGESKKLNVFDISNNQAPLQTIPVENEIKSGLFVEPDTLYIGCELGHLYIFKVNNS